MSVTSSILSQPVGPMLASSQDSVARVRAFDDDVRASLGDEVETWMTVARIGADIRHTPEYAALHLARPDVPRSLPGLWVETERAHAILLPKRIVLPRPVSWLRPEPRGYWLAGNSPLASAAHRKACSTGPEGEWGPLMLDCARAVQSHDGDFLLIEDLEVASPLHHATLRLADIGWRVCVHTGWQARWRIRFPEVPADYWAKFHSKRRGNLRRQQRKLGGDVIRVTEPGDVDHFLRLAGDVSRTTWQSRVLGQRVSGDDFERRVHDLAARSGALRSYLLLKENRPISFVMGIQHGETFHLEEIGYDPDFAEWSPGMVLLCHVLDDLIAENTPVWFDFGGGDAAYKRTLANQESLGGTICLVPPGLSRRATFGLVDATAWLRSQARRWARPNLTPPAPATTTTFTAPAEPVKELRTEVQATEAPAHEEAG